jgi:integrase
MLDEAFEQLRNERDAALSEVGRLHMLLEQTPPGSGGGFLTLGELVEYWERYGVSRGKASKTKKVDTWALKLFISRLGAELDVRMISELKFDDYRAYLVDEYEGRKGKLSTTSVETYLRPVKAMLRWSARRHYIRPLQFDTDEVLAAPSEPKATFSPSDFDKLLDAADEELTPLLRLRARAILLLLADTGMRASELCAAKWGDVLPKVEAGSRSYRLTIQGAKRTGSREVRLSLEVYETIADYRAEMLLAVNLNPETIFVAHRGRGAGRPLTVDGLGQMCARLAERAGVAVANPHAYRRFFAHLSLYEDDIQPDVEAMMLIGGWRERKTIEKHYARRQGGSVDKWHEQSGPLAKLARLKKYP